MPKGISLAEATLNSEKIKPVALAIIELPCLKASVSQAVSQQKIPINKNSVESISDQSESLFGLSFT